MYRAFAPFFETVRGDRRVTGCAGGSAAVSAASVGAFAKEIALLLKEIRIMGIIGLRESVVGIIILMILSFNNLGGHLGCEFSRESGGGDVLGNRNVCLRH
jgi:hypothetical protein